MTIEQLRNRLSFLNDANEHISLSMYLILKNGDIRFANLEEAVRNELKTKFLNYLNGRINNDGELNYCNLTDYTDRKNTVCYYDLPEPLPGLQPLNVVTTQEGQQEFSFIDDDFSNIEGFVFLIGNETNKIALYKKHYSLSLIKRDSSFVGLRKSETGLVRLESDILKVNETFEFLQVDNHVIVFSIKSLESSFGYTGILMRAAKTKFDLIQEAELIENVEELEELIQEKKFAKKIVKIKADTPVLALPFDRLKTFILGHPKLKRRLKFNDAEDRIKFHSKTSKELFLKLLSDSYLKSELTDLLYETDEKEQLSNEEID
ncbi:anti-phage protein KwaB [Pedobacter sp. UBA4863]|uniref:anti-phage protein KwaB n=1 Tax=Pedobacter sp. UBA4863 TaxID=1947060 RepID=UPI0025DFC3DC|nr:anti-phage protein KwaB [Pedobacter sp. UBA4863]